MTVTPVDDAPVAITDTYTVTENGTLTIDAPGVLVNDTDPDGHTPRVIMFNNPQHGTLTGGASDGSFSYVPAAGYIGVDTFDYQISDGQGQPQYATGTITVTVIANRAPVAVEDTYTVTEGTPGPSRPPGRWSTTPTPTGTPRWSSCSTHRSTAP